MRIVVTGGAGFIGANLCRRLVTHGIDVVVIDDLSTGRASNLDGVAVRFVQASVLDRSTLHALTAGAHSIVHLAARPSVPRSLADPIATHEANATGTLRVLEAARATGTAHVVVASSSSVYGANPALPKHEGLVAQPRSPYAASKLAAEAYTLAYASSFDLKVLALRFFNVFGPLQAADHAYAAVIPSFVAAALDGHPLQLHGDGSQSRDFTFVDSVTRVLADAAVRHVKSETPVNLAFGSRISLLEVIARLEQTVGYALEVERVDPRPGDVAHSQADCTRFGELFPDARPVPFTDGLAATVDWFRSIRVLAGRP